MRILITGGAGFIGSWIAHHLDVGRHQLLTVDDLSGGHYRNVNGPFQQATLVDAAEVNRIVGTFRPHMIVHCAAYAAEGLSHWMRSFTYDNNKGYANLCNAAINNDVQRMVVLSSMAVYGSQEPPFTEDMPCQPEDPYGASKAAIEADTKALAAVFGISTLIVRPHNVFGPRQNLADPYRNVVAIFMRQALQGLPITVYGDGSQTRAFSFVEDVSRAIATLAVSDVETTVNIGGEDPCTIANLARQVKALTGASSPIVCLPPRHEVADAYSNHDRLRGLLGGWDPTPLEVGLGRMVEWAKTVEIGQLRQYDYETDVKLYVPWVR